MKRTLAVMLAAMFALLPCAVSEGTENAALDAFMLITGQPAITPAPGFVWERTPAEYLADIMAGKYDAGTEELTADLDALAAITAADIADYAAANSLPEKQVRNRYYRALAAVLRAEIAADPASEERYRNIQLILALFLEDNEDELSVSSRKAIRSQMTREYAEVIAADYQLPADFVEFIIMDDEWDDDIWDNDDDWKTAAGYDDTPYSDTPYDDTPVQQVVTDVPVQTAAPVNYDNTPDYNTPDHNTPDYNTPDHNTPDYNTPDYNTPEHNTPDYNTPDYNTPDHNTPDYDNTPDD